MRQSLVQHVHATCRADVSKPLCPELPFSQRFPGLTNCARQMMAGLVTGSVANRPRRKKEHYNHRAHCEV